MTRARTRQNRRGFVLVTMAASALVIFGALGLSVDIGRMYVAKSEVQAFTDAAALAATLRLNGTNSGFDAARAAAANSINRWNFNSANVPSPQVDFATAMAGPWEANPASAAGYICTRVRASVQVPLYFVGMVVAQSQSSVSAKSVAAQLPISTMRRGLGPFTAVTTNPTDPDFGFTRDQQYAIQWPAFNGGRHGCPAIPANCFVQPPCAGDSNAALSAVAQYWGSANNGYWGDNSAHTINQAILDLLQLQPLSIGQLIALNNGNKAAEAFALDTRTNQDLDTIHNTVSAYLNDPYHNGRRFLAVPVVEPTAWGTYVRGYASFLLITNGTPSDYYGRAHGNDPFCAIYAGSYVQGSTDPGGAGQTNAYRVALVQ